MATCRCVHLGISYNITHTTDDLQNQRCKGLILLGIYPTGAAPYHSTQHSPAQSILNTDTACAEEKDDGDDGDGDGGDGGDGDGDGGANPPYRPSSALSETKP